MIPRHKICTLCFKKILDFFAVILIANWVAIVVLRSLGRDLLAVRQLLFYFSDQIKTVNSRDILSTCKSNNKNSQLVTILQRSSI